MFFSVVMAASWSAAGEHVGWVIARWIAWTACNNLSSKLGVGSGR